MTIPEPDLNDQSCNVKDGEGHAKQEHYCIHVGVASVSNADCGYA